MTGHVVRYGDETNLVNECHDVIVQLDKEGRGECGFFFSELEVLR